MKNLTTAIVLLLCFNATAQSIDTVITTTAYTSYFNYELHEPLYVAYKLYHGGGDCSRKGDRFTTAGLVQSATGADYKGGGYDEGHLANSKDFAYDCDLQKSTFRFYNCVPQSQALNRGIWKVWETTIRRESQTDSLMIYCGSIFTTRKLNNIGIPDQCWKVVYSLSTGEILQCMIFENDTSNTYKDILLSDLRHLIGYHLCF